MVHCFGSKCISRNHLELIFVCGVVDDMVVLLCYEVFVVLNFSLG